MVHRRLLLSVLSFACGRADDSLTSTEAGGPARFEPAQGIYFGLGQYNIDEWTAVHYQADTLPALRAIQERSGATPQVLSYYTSCDGGRRDPDTDLAWIEAQQRLVPHLAVIAIGCTNVDVVAGLLAGHHDHHLRRLGAMARAQNFPILFRPLYEINDYGAHGAVLEEYARIHGTDAGSAARAAFLRIRSQVVAGAGGDLANAGWVFHAVPVPGRDYAPYFPGPDAVDWVGASVYAASDIAALPDTIGAFARAVDRPVFIVESGDAIAPGGAASVDALARYFEPYFALLRDPAQRIRGFTYISQNFDEGDPFGDWQDARLTANPAIVDWFAAQVADPLFRPAVPTVAPAVAPACDPEFRDVPPHHPFHAEIRCLAAHCVAAGSRCSDDPTARCYRPDEPITRSSAATLLTRAGRLGLPSSGGQTFADVPEWSATRFQSYQWLMIEPLGARGIAVGADCGDPSGRWCFAPDAPLQKQGMAKFTALTAGLPAPPAGSRTFVDVPPEHPSWTYIEALARAGVIDGGTCPDGIGTCFLPEATVLRSHAAKFVARALLPGCVP